MAFPIVVIIRAADMEKPFESGAERQRREPAPPQGYLRFFEGEDGRLMAVEATGGIRQATPREAGFVMRKTVQTVRAELHELTKSAALAERTRIRTLMSEAGFSIERGDDGVPDARLPIGMPDVASDNLAEAMCDAFLGDR